MKGWFYAKPRRVFRVLPIALDAAVSTLRIAVEYTGRFVLCHERRPESCMELTPPRNLIDIREGPVFARKLLSVDATDALHRPPRNAGGVPDRIARI